MAGIIEKHAQTPITLKRRTGILDGKPQWSESAALAFVLDFTERDAERFGVLKNAKVFLVAPVDPAPEVPGVVVCDGKTYDIKGVKTYKNLRGVLVGWRVAASAG